jgi:hypothetical protein
LSQNVNPCKSYTQPLLVTMPTDVALCLRRFVWRKKKKREQDWAADEMV